MFKTYNVTDSLWQMNLFMALQTCRTLSTLSTLAATHAADDEAEQDQIDAEDPGSARSERDAA